jgi:hypothetical protein
MRNKCKTTDGEPDLKRPEKRLCLTQALERLVFEEPIQE